MGFVTFFIKNDLHKNTIYSIASKKSKHILYFCIDKGYVWCYNDKAREKGAGKYYVGEGFEL